jgi:hypothetical protein
MAPQNCYFCQKAGIFSIHVSKAAATSKKIPRLVAVYNRKPQIISDLIYIAW